VALWRRSTTSYKNKKPFIHVRDEGPLAVLRLLRGTTRIRRWSLVTFDQQTLLNAITGSPGGGYCAALLRSPAQSLFRMTGEFGLILRSRWALCWALTSLSQLADGMTYYSYPDFYISLSIIAQERKAFPFALAGGPRGIRTPDLLNAIETRSQLRYGPGCQ
jgi:hypothetical protein